MILAVPALGCDNGGALAASRFDANAEGWTLNGDAAASAVELRAAGGNPGGHICGSDAVGGDLWYFVAPAPFRGDLSKAYNLRVTWDLKQSAQFNLLSGRDVIIQGNGMALIFNVKAPPGRDWTSYSARLDATANSGWKVDQVTGANPKDFPDATEAEMKGVLKNVSSVRFRGEFYDGPDSACIDNVFFGIE